MEKSLTIGELFNGVNTVENIITILKDSGQNLEIDTTHIFSGGMYCRTFFPKKNTFVVGKIHRFAGFNMLLKGSVAIYDGDSVINYTAPATFSTHGNDRKLGYFTEDSEFAFVSTCFADNVEEAEEELFYPDDTTMEQVLEIERQSAILLEKIKLLEIK